MDLKLSVHSGSTVEDLLVSLDATATVTDVADALRRRAPAGMPTGPLTLARASGNGWRPLPPDVLAVQAGVSSGMAVTVVAAQSLGRTGSGDAVASLSVLDGPDAGREFPLREGDTVIGRSPQCQVQLNDPLVSKRHAVLHVGAGVDVVDLNSSNGIEVDGVLVPRARLNSGTRLVLGDTTVVVRSRRADLGTDPTTVEINRSPLLEPVHPGVQEELPQAPARPVIGPLPLISLLVPMLIGGIMYLITRQVLAVVFIALSPLFSLGTLAESWISGRRTFRKQTAAFRAELAALTGRANAELELERAGRLAENPSAGECLAAVAGRRPLLWSRSPQHPRFLQVRLGLAAMPSRSSYQQAQGRDGAPELLAESAAVAAQFAIVGGVPVVGDLTRTAVGVCGPGRSDATRGLVVQLLGLHAAGELQVAALVPGQAVGDWAWLRWTPHTLGAGPLGSVVLGSDQASCALVVSALEQLVEDRLAAAGPGGAGNGGDAPQCAIVVLVEEGAQVERGRLLATIARGREVGVHLLWTADAVTQLPAACGQFLDLTGPAVGDVATGEAVSGVQPEGVTAEQAEAFARALAPAIDAAAVPDGQSDLPRSAALLDQEGKRSLLGPGSSVADRWQESGSLFAEPRERAGTLRALVGVAAGAPFTLDLRDQGPHALVGGTTGAGKSEFLQTWILGMALDHSPRRVTFLLVDYKGGSAFSDCEDLPHTVGLVTDLTPRLVTRALTSLKAELRHREHLLNEAGKPDLLSMEREGLPQTPPSLVIVVDEFAALVQEVPEFVDGVIDVAQRGRSLGLHLVLATQRPAGVIKDNLRANTNLRVALRMADEEDSVDVIGSPQAALFSPDIPGRAVAKTGPGRTTAFQALYVGGRTPETPPPASIGLTPMRFGALVPWKEPEDRKKAPPVPGPTDIRRLVDAVISTAKELDLPEPRKPWLPVLDDVAELADLPSRRRDDELVFGVIDVPEAQQRDTATYRPDVDGTLLVVGTGGSGKSTALRTLALAAGATAALGGGSCQVYALDFGARGLTALEQLPHVGAVITGDDHERIARLLGRLRALVEERAARYATARAGTIGEYRQRSGAAEEPRILLLVDNFAAFRQAYETGPHARLFDTLLMLAQDGRPVGVHLVLTADRVGAVPAGLSATVQKRLVLRLSQETELAMTGLRADSFDADSPPGRGYLEGLETQVAVLGASANPAEQAERVQELAELMRRHDVPQAPPVERLPDRVHLDDLPVLVGDHPAFGLADDTMAATGFDAGGPFLLAGPPQSGRTTVLATLVRALRRAHPDLPLLHVGQRRSPVLSVVDWEVCAATEDEVYDLATGWTERAKAGERFAVVVEGIPDFLSSVSESYLQDLIGACARAGNCVIAEGDTSQLGSSWPLLQAVKSARHGLLLQPDQADGDALLRTNFPRLSRAEFPLGRGLYVRSGRFVKVQVALPD